MSPRLPVSPSPRLPVSPSPGYAAKTGSEWVQNGTTRRLVFGFTGWSEVGHVAAYDSQGFFHPPFSGVVIGWVGPGTQRLKSR